MQTLHLEDQGDHMPVVERAVSIFARGGVCVFPTDTLYALGANALNANAVGRLFDIKHRSYMKAVPMLVRDLSWARELAYIAPDQEALITRFWPGKVTFILPRRPIVPAIMCGGGQTVGIRAPEHSFLQNVLRHLGYPLAAASASLPHQNAGTGEELKEVFERASTRPDLLIDAGPLPVTQPSTVVDLSGRTPRILRQGAVRADKILAYL